MSSQAQGAVAMQAHGKRSAALGTRGNQPSPEVGGPKRLAIPRIRAARFGAPPTRNHFPGAAPRADVESTLWA